LNKAVLWDLDGTLVDSEEYHWIAWRETLAAEGVTITRKQFLESFGQKNDRILGNWLPGNPPADTITRIGDAKEAEYRRLAVERGLAPLPGAAEWLLRLRKAGWRQAIASSAPRQNVEVVLQALALQDYFDAITSAEDVTAGKPDPQVFLAAASRLDVPASRCVVVEDAAAGVEAARRAAMRCVGVSRIPLEDADVSVGSLDELPAETFERLLGR
jgi:beta-phosphoglucomutase family hydrolase